MTFTLNGIGTKYYGKRKRSVREKQCESCGRVGKLASYDTTRFFVFFFIPLIPLGRFHILDDCPSCRRHRLIAEKDWRHLTETTLAEATAAFRNQPSRDTACGLMGLLSELNLEEAFRDLAPELEQKAGEDAVWLGVLGTSAQHFGDEALADRCFRRSRQYEDLPWVRYSWAWLLLEQGRLDEARAQIGAVDAQGGNADLYLALIEGMLAAGRHEEAAIELRGLAGQVPGIGKNKRFKKAAKAAEKYRGTGKKLEQFTPRQGEKAPWGATEIKPGLLMAILALILLGLGAAAYVQSSYVDVWVLGGLEAPYGVEVGGKELQLSPGKPQKVTLATGKLKVAADYGKKKEEFEIEIVVPWDEIFSRRTVVLNPDQVALLFLQRMLYVPNGSVQPPDDERMKFELLTGKRLYQRADIDYAFKDFPETIELSSKKEEWRCQLAAESLPSATYFSLLQNLGAKVAEEQLERYAALIEPDEATRLSWLAFLPAERFAALAKEELERHPPAIAWHRTYQSLAGHVGKEEALVEFYRNHLKEHLDDSGWLYLLARIVPAAEKQRLFERATQVPQPSPWAFHGLAWRKFERGRFDEALPFCRKSRQLDPDEPIFRGFETDLLLATGATAAVLEMGDLLDPMPRIALLAAAGRESEVGALLAPLLAELDPPNRAEVKQLYESELCYPQGLDCYEEKLAEAKSRGAQYRLGLLRRDDALVAQNSGEDPMSFLWRAAIAPAGPAAQAHKEKAAALLAQATLDTVVAAKALREESFSREDLLGAALDLDMKALVLFLVGREKGDREMLELAARLNYRPSIFQHLLRRELEEKRRVRAEAG